MFTPLEISRFTYRKQFIVLATTACIANTIGFLSNVFLFGFSIPSIICGICALLIYVFTYYGVNKSHTAKASLLILLLVNFFEFPFLFIIYSNNTLVYMVLGIVGFIVFLRRKMRIFYCSLAVLFDLAIFLLTKIHPLLIEDIHPDDAFGAMVISYLIVITSISALLILMFRRYDIQNKLLLQLATDLKNQANLDPLTGLYNRRYLSNYIERRTLSATPFSLVLIDIDDFKLVNDNYGHIFGDEVLVNFAKILQRKIDENGIAARYGGEEFMLVIKSTQRTDLIKIIDEISEEFKTYAMQAKNTTLSFSAGIEPYKSDYNVSSFFKAIDDKLYEAKRTGKNKIVA